MHTPTPTWYVNNTCEAILRHINGNVVTFMVWDKQAGVVVTKGHTVMVVLDGGVGGAQVTDN